MNIIPYLASKYLKFKASDRGISTIAIIAFFTIVISSAAAVVILSAVNGFHFSLMDKLMTKDSHVTIQDYGGNIQDYKEYVLELNSIPGVVSVIPLFQRQVLIGGASQEKGVEIMALPADYPQDDKDFKKQFQVTDGEFDLSGGNAIVLGDHLAGTVGARVGDTVRVMIFDSDFLVRQLTFRVAGTFTAGHKDFDSGLAFISFKTGQKLFALKYDGTVDETSAGKLAVKVEHPHKVEEYIRLMDKKVPFAKRTWKQDNANQLAAIDNEKVIMNVILFFFFVVVFFNILSTMIGMVVDKKEEIGILKAMGLKPGDALQVFLVDGFLLGAAGSSLGVILGLFFSVSLNAMLHGIEKFIDFINWGSFYLVNWIQPMAPPSPFEFFKSSVYYINEFPIKIMYGDLVFVILLSVIVSTLAVIFPAIKASKMKPVEVLRND